MDTLHVKSIIQLHLPTSTQFVRPLVDNNVSMMIMIKFPKLDPLIIFSREIKIGIGDQSLLTYAFKDNQL